MDQETYEDAFRLCRLDQIEIYLRYGFEPPTIKCIDNLDRRLDFTAITRHYCKKAVITTLCISKTLKQPLSSMVWLISKKVWETRNDDAWLKSIKYNWRG